MSTDPTNPPPRTIVLCFDGTSNQYDATNTNVVKFYALLDKRSPLEQVVYYQPGVGTYFNPGIVGPLLTWFARMADEAVAWYLDEHVRAGYKFLMQNYRDGDKICLFGFSRGAYTARALAGLLHKIGLLPRDNDEQVAIAYSIYTGNDKTLAEGFKETFCTPVKIDFIGVWDTVASVGLIYRRELPFTSANSAVRVFRHALSLDEHRARFQPNLFHHEALTGTANPVKNNTPSPATPGHSDHPPDAEEVWFAGCHSDVGGGAVENDVDHSLANISLRWMVKQVVISQCGIKFDQGALGKAYINVPSIIPGVPSTSSASPGEDNREIQAQKLEVGADIHDELKIQWRWWLLEIIPMKYMWQEDNGKFGSKWGINFGKGREIRVDQPNFHESVRQRMADPNLNYQPRATWPEKTERYVE